MTEALRTDLQIVALDPHDDDTLVAWHGAYEAAERAQGPDVGSPWAVDEVRVMMQETTSRRSVHGWVGLVDGRVVTSGFLDLPLLDNLDRATLVVHTHPEARRRGYGRAMARHVEQEARERGRTVVVTESAWSASGAADGRGHAGPELARSLGYELALTDVKRMLDLPVPDALLDELAAEAAPHHEAYTLRAWVGPVPDDLVDSWARLASTLITEAPMGELEVEAEHVDAATIREDDAVVAKQGRTKYNAVALDASGEVVAYTDIARTVHESDRAYQWGTLVHPDHRGHRLGLAVKVANLRLLQSDTTDAHRLVTYNADVNAHMIAVNERLGFVPVARLGEFQKRLA